MKVRTSSPSAAALRLALLVAAATLVLSCAANGAASTPVVTGTPVAAQPSPVPTPGAVSPTPIPIASPLPAIGPTLAATPIPTGPPPAAPMRLAGYLAAWTTSGPNFHNADVHPDLLTHILYAFENVSAGGECVPGDAKADAQNLPALNALKQQHPSLQTLLSVGGYAESLYFSDAAVSSEARLRFAQSCLQATQQNGFDGIDVDWEFPVLGGPPGSSLRPEDRQNFTLLLAELRWQLDELGKSDGRHYLLTIAAPAGPTEYANIELPAIHPYLDWLNLMTYDFYIGTSPITNFNAPLFRSSTDPGKTAAKLKYNVDSAVQAFLAGGVPAAKIVLGVSLYARGWKGVPDKNHGLYQSNGGPATDASVPKAAWQSGGAIAYRDVKQYYLDSYPRYWQDEAQVPWLYNPASGLMISYEDPQSLDAKADYARRASLGGMMLWELSADDEQRTLVRALSAALQK